MSWIDLLRMSGSNLKRRKLRTFLTVLGVIIGTASIVVMISLGLGLQESLYREVENSGGLTSIKVTGASAGDSMYSYSYGSESGEESKKYINDRAVGELAQVEHVTNASPVYEMWVNMIKGKYEGSGQLVAMTPEGLAAKNIPLGEGTLPTPGGRYYETMEMPDIDFLHDSIFLILDQDGYYNNMGSGLDMGVDEGGGQMAKSKTVKKHVVRACGMVKGGPEEYNANYYYIYCDLDTLKQILKKEFSGRAIPGQPTTKSGKPYKEFCYSYAQVNVDDIENVDAVAAAIREMGYNVETNAEYLNSMKSQFAIIQAVLGGIGAVSLFVAAIGITNTMMMSIYERTKEIGVIKVLGCSLKNIKQMFLLEAAFIGLMGGAIGNVLSFLMSSVINFLTGNGAAMGFDGNISYIPVWLVLLSMGFAMLVGVIAGYFPALRAMKLSPLAAIRNE